MGIDPYWKLWQYLFSKCDSKPWWSAVRRLGQHQTTLKLEDEVLQDPTTILEQGDAPSESGRHDEATRPHWRVASAHLYEVLGSSYYEPPEAAA